MSNILTVALVQASPIFNNLSASLEKAVELNAKAAKDGAKLVAFGECWLAGYPAWLDFSPNAALWNFDPTKRVFAEMRRNSLVVGGAQPKCWDARHGKIKSPSSSAQTKRSKKESATARFITRC